MVFSEENLPIGTWVKVALPGSSSSRPGLVSASCAGKVTVIVPRPSAGVALQRVPDILLDMLQPLDRDQDPEDLERKFLVDLMFEPLSALVGAQRAARQSGPPVSRAAVTDTVKAALLSAEEAQAKARSALRSRLRKCSSEVPAPSTPPRSSQVTPKKLRKTLGVDGEEARQAPSTPPKSNARLLGGKATPRKSRKQAADLQSCPPQAGSVNFTMAVGRELALQASGGEAALTRRELDEKLKAFFTAEEIEQGLKRLDSMNKITLIDGMVFRV